MAYDVSDLLRQLDIANSRKSQRKRRKLVTKLALSESPDACVALEETLSSEGDDLTRALAAKGLGLQSTDSARLCLLAYAQDKSPKVRSQIARALGAHSSPDTFSCLEKALTSDEDKAVRFTAAKALVQLGGDSAREALLAGLNHDSPATRRRVIYSLGDLADPAAIPQLEERRTSESRFLQSAIDDVIKKLEQVPD